MHIEYTIRSEVKLGITEDGRSSQEKNWWDRNILLLTGGEQNGTDELVNQLYEAVRLKN